MLKNLYNFVAKSSFAIILVIPLTLFIVLRQKEIFMSKKKKIFVINSTKFTDLAQIKKNSNFSYYILSTRFMLALLSPWFKDLDKNEQFSKYGDRVAFIKTKNEFFLNKREGIRKFHERVTLRVCKILKIKCIFSPGLHYITDADLGYICEKNNIPFIAFHKECLLMTKKQQEISFNFFSKIFDYKASIAFVFNQTVKEILHKCNLDIKNIITAAPPRLNTMNEIFSKKYEGKKKIVFFSFSPNHAVPGPMNAVNSKDNFNFDFKWKKIFFHTHIEFLKLADKYPDEIFLIKFKGKLKKFDAEAEIKKVFLEEYKKEFPKNIEVAYEEADPYELMMQAKIFISFNSTCIIESGLLDLPILVPNFFEAKSEYKDLALFSNYREEYEIIDDPENFFIAIEKHIISSDFRASDEIKRKRLDLFNKFLTSRYVNYLQDYEKHILKLIT